MHVRRTTRLFTVTIGAGLFVWACVFPATTHGAVTQWLGSNGIFDNPGEWNAGVPGVGDVAEFIQNPPVIVVFDSNEISDELRVLDGDVTFVSNSTSLRIYNVTTNLATMNINGGSLQIGTATNPMFMNSINMNIGDGSNGILAVEGSNSLLSVANGTTNIGQRGARGDLILREGGTASIATNSGVLNIGDSGFDATLGEVSVSGASTLSTGHIRIAPFTSQATGSMTVSGTGGNSSIKQTRAGADLTVGSTSGGAGTLDVEAGGTFTSGTGTTTVNATGQVDINGGTYNANGNLIVNGGSFTGSFTNSGDALNLASGIAVAVQNSGQLTINTAQLTIGEDFYNVDQANTINLTDSGSVLDYTGRRFRIQGNSTLNVTNGADAQVHTNLDLGNSLGAGTLFASDADSSVVADPSNEQMWWGRDGNNATVTFTNGASGSFLGGVEIENQFDFFAGSGGTTTATVSSGRNRHVRQPRYRRTGC